MALYERLKNSSNFTSAEKAVADYIVKNPREAINLNVDELANATYSSPSCIVRLTKKLGLKGYSDFKIKLAIELNSLLIGEKRLEINMPFDQDTDVDDIPKHLFNLYHQVLLDAYNSLDLAAIKKTVNMIHEADEITIFGVGSSISIIEDFVGKCHKLRLPIYPNTTRGYENVHRKKYSKKPIALVISSNASSSEIKNWVFENNYYDIPVILITANPKTPLKKLCDTFLCIEQQEQPVLKLGPLASKITISFILDNIYMMLFMKDYQQNIDYIQEFNNKILKNREDRLKDYYTKK